MIIIDVEIKRGILEKGEKPLPDIQYCAGWRDFKNMGVACVCTFDTDSGLSRVFTDQRLKDLQEYLDGAYATGGFNTRRFDMPLLVQHGVLVSPVRHYDALEQIWLKLGLDPDNYVHATHGGWSLDAIMQDTFGLAKTGHGAMAPVWWQQGQNCRVVDYCLNDVWLEAKLCQHMLAGGTVKAAGKEPLQFTPTMVPE